LTDLQKLQAIQSEAPTFLELSMGDTVYWGMVPILAEGGIIGALGIGTRDDTRQFTSVDTRILTRMAERVSGYITAVQLAYSREREAAHARELHIANEIQQSIQPETAPHRSEIAMASYWSIDIKRTRTHAKKLHERCRLLTVVFYRSNFCCNPFTF
jgi:hypothetical protein